MFCVCNLAFACFPLEGKHIGCPFFTPQLPKPRLEKLRREEQEKLHSFQLLKQRLGCNVHVSGMLKPCALVF